MTVFASLLAALMAAGAYLSIPIGPVPILLQNMFVLLADLLLGSRWGLAGVAVYFLTGVCAGCRFLPAVWAESDGSWGPPAVI